MRKEERESEEAVSELRKILSAGDTIYTILRHVAQSGMQRAISVIFFKNDKPLDLSWLTAKALGWKFHKDHYGVKVDGCGMDMGFHLIYSLSSVIFAKEDKEQREQKKVTNNHSPIPTERNVGYWLNQRWL